MRTRERILRFIRDFRAARAFGPTTREIADGVGLASNSTAALHLGMLRRKGLVTWATFDDGTMVARSVRLTPAGRAAVQALAAQEERA